MELAQGVRSRWCDQGEIGGIRSRHPKERVVVSIFVLLPDADELLSCQKLNDRRSLATRYHSSGQNRQPCCR
jgi:hypothetical protein